MLMNKNKAMCPVCSKIEKIDEVSFNTLFKNKIFYCNNCFSTFDFPPPTEIDLGNYYNKQSSDRHSIGRKFKESHEYKRWLRAYDQYRYIKPFLDKQKIHKICDIGCGFGNLISLLNNYAECYGTEPNIKYREEGITNIKMNIKKDIYKIPSDTNLIILSHILEHLSNPKRLLDEINKTFTNLEYIFIEQPLISPNLIQYMVQNNKLGGEHVTMFSLNSLIKFMDNNGWIPFSEYKPVTFGAPNRKALNYNLDKDFDSVLRSHFKSLSVLSRFRESYGSKLGSIFGTQFIAKNVSLIKLKNDPIISTVYRGIFVRR